ncbi:MAG: PD-(D/E)XK nuclease family protein, partial [Gaiellaceae bacterium]
EALVAVLASPLVGVSNDALVLLRRAASRRPIFAGLERSLPPGLEQRDGRLMAAFLQRYERLLKIAESASLEELIERIAIEHDYELAILARWDGRRRYANLRKLGRLARSYEDLRGSDVEGFIRFVRELDEVGARETEAVSEEEDADAVRLMTIHAAKGLEFKVVAVVDAGRAVTRVQSSEILCLPDGKFGFSVVDPLTGKRRPAPGYEQIKSEEQRAAEDEARRLYYVAMTRAIDRLLITGSVDTTRRTKPTPIDWVLSGIEADLASEEPRELLVEETPVLLRVVRDEGEWKQLPQQLEQLEEQLPLFPGPGDDPVASGPPELPPLVDPPAPPRHSLRRLSYSALALYERCSLRFWAERFAGLRARERVGTIDGAEGLNPLEVGDAVHVLIETSMPVQEIDGWLRARYPHVISENIERVRGQVEAWNASELASEVQRSDTRVELPFTFVHDGVLLHGRFDAFSLREGHALLVDYKTNRLEGRDAEQIVDTDYAHQLTVYALAAFRAGATDVDVAYVFLEQPDRPVVRRFGSGDVETLAGRLSDAIARINDGEFEPSPSEFGCPECPLHEVACDGLAMLEEERTLEATALGDPGPEQ